MSSVLRLLHVAPLPPPWTGIGVSVQHALASAPLQAQANWVINSSRGDRVATSGTPKKPTPERMLRHARLAARVALIVRERQIHVVHLHGSSHDLSLFGNWLSIVAAKRAGAQAVWHLHEDLAVVAFPGRTPLTRKAFGALMAAPDAVAVLTPKDRRLATSFVAKRRLAVVPPTCGADFLSQPITRPRQPIRVLYVGWLSHAKGINDLVRVASGVQDAGIDIVFDVLGTGRTAADTDAVRRAIDERGLASTVLLHGVRTGQAKCDSFARANVLFTPTHWDAFPVVILEAMAAGLPVLGSEVGGLPSMLEQGRGAVLTEVGDVDAMVAALLQLARSPDLRDAMGAANRARFLELYHPDRVGQLMLDLYRELIDRAS